MSITLAVVMVMGFLASSGVDVCVTKPVGHRGAGGLLCIVLSFASG